MDDERLRAFLESGNERPVIWLLRANRIALLLAGALLVAFLASLAVAAWASARVWLVRGFALMVVGAFVLKLAVRVADRRAMEKDLALLEEHK